MDSTDREYSETPQFSKFYDSSTRERVPLNDVVANHLAQCETCQATMQRKPMGLGQTSRLCFEYQDIIEDYAELEGILNNVVAHDEYGNQAPREGRQQ